MNAHDAARADLAGARATWSRHEGRSATVVYLPSVGWMVTRWSGSGVDRSTFATGEEALAFARSWADPVGASCEPQLL